MGDPADTSPRSSLLPGSRLLLDTASGPIAIFAIGGAVHAIDDGCLRCGSTLVTGVLDGCVVTCGTCGWQYDVVNGCLVGLPALRVRTFEVRASRAERPDGARDTLRPSARR
jgi:3-phenylpropionate/trans-cinnamate dioxygenase ferredoxin subunit